MQCYGINHTMYLMLCGQYLSFLYLSHLFAGLGAVRDVEIHCIDPLDFQVGSYVKHKGSDPQDNLG